MQYVFHHQNVKSADVVSTLTISKHLSTQMLKGTSSIFELEMFIKKGPLNLYTGTAILTKLLQQISYLM